jgi:hypothetical protein
MSGPCVPRDATAVVESSRLLRSRFPPEDSRLDRLAAAIHAPTKYQRQIAAGLNRAFDHRETEELELDLDSARLVIFSDHHKGARDGADDFWRCERSYHAALGYYLESGHTLVVLGDVEELWENAPKTAVEKYTGTLALEAEFHRAGRYERFWGNHDDSWGGKDDVRELLEPIYGKLHVREALRLKVVSGGATLGLLFLVHGHQGTKESDTFAPISRWVVRHAWRPLQRRLGMPSTTPSRDYELREEHDAAMYAWARSHRAKPVLVAGHTHRPVFGTTTPKPPSDRPASEVERDLREQRESGRADPEAVAGLRAELEFVRTPPFGPRPQPMPVPCYFNTGCCSFGDGDVTGLEVDNGEIRLVRWLDDDYKPRRKLLAGPESLRDILAAVTGSGDVSADALTAPGVGSDERRESVRSR